LLALKTVFQPMPASSNVKAYTTPWAKFAVVGGKVRTGSPPVWTRIFLSPAPNLVWKSMGAHVRRTVSHVHSAALASAGRAASVLVDGPS